VKAEKPVVRSRLLSARQAAAYTGLSYTYLRDLVRAGQLPVVKFGDGKWARWFFRREHLDTLIDTHTERAS
jgi:excisionase family DNA binding protein